MKIIISQNNSKQRIDRFLVKELFSYSRGEIIRNINSGSVLVNGRQTKPSHILKENDEIKIDIKKEDKKLIPNKKVKLEIVYSDRNIIVINKSAGLQVHPVKSVSAGHGASPSDTLVHGLLNKFPEIININDGSEGSELRPGIVHRLDKDTSGVMVVARNQKAFEELKKLFQNREVKKEYLAVVFGRLKNKKGTIEKPIARSQNYKKQTIASARTRTKIRPAVTRYEVLKEYADYSLVAVRPKTGRTHQIRIHLSALGHPVVGDEKYKRKNLRMPESVKRQLLHASRLEFESFGKKHSFKSPLPTDFCHFLRSLDEDRIKG
ncbi:MAG: RluA family pseudouridine synthase [Patescibacteria group bacterium]